MANLQQALLFIVEKRQLDLAGQSLGIVTSKAYDFKGNLLRSRRDLLPDYKKAVDNQKSTPASAKRPSMIHDVHKNFAWT